MTISQFVDQLIRLSTQHQLAPQGQWDPDVVVRDQETSCLRSITGIKLTDNDPHGDESDLVVLVNTGGYRSEEKK